ncbi:MAG: putative electron transport protein YccM [Promethearchaeota archaeon]|nr:MAG: putative electron transport protein YccM [Candidatus Lokiarchaeota archaeon]
MLDLEKRKSKNKSKKITIIRHCVQIISFVFFHYVILELLFTINLNVFEGVVKVQPFLSSPRNSLTDGGGIVEFMFYFFTQGTFPLLLIGVFVLLILLTNRFVCGWLCPIGAIQDVLSYIPADEKTISYTTHQRLLKIKYFIIILLILIMVSLWISKIANEEFYESYKQSVGLLGTRPIAFFSLSEFLFVFLPDVVANIFLTASLAPIFADFWSFFAFFFYMIIIILSVFYPRAYCRYICPFGALCARISKYSFLKLTRNPVKCVGRQECGVCERMCPKQIRILDETFEGFYGEGECNLCGKCLEECPYDAIEIKFG